MDYYIGSEWFRPPDHHAHSEQFVQLHGLSGTSAIPTLAAFGPCKYSAEHVQSMEPGQVRFGSGSPVNDVPFNESKGAFLTRLGLSSIKASNIVLIPQSIFKCHPRMDGVLRRVLLADPNSVVVYVWFSKESQQLQVEQLRTRFRKRILKTVRSAAADRRCCVLHVPQDVK